MSTCCKEKTNFDAVCIFAQYFCFTCQILKCRGNMIEYQGQKNFCPQHHDKAEKMK